MNEDNWGQITKDSDNSYKSLFRGVECELNSSKLHIILIDDVKLFSGKNEYPRIEEVFKYIESKNSNYSICIEKNIIIATPVQE